jgi:hypothetical protein
LPDTNLDYGGFSTAKTKFALQEFTKGRPLSIPPKYLLVPPALETRAIVLRTSPVLDGGTVLTGNVNPHYKLAEVVSTPKANHYTMIAATIVESKPLVLTFVCDYGITPSPEPTPTPTPEPMPEPKTIKDWVTQNRPKDGAAENDISFLAATYESAASAMERGTIRTTAAGYAAIRTTAAGYAAIRTASQTKINPKIWSEFLNGLEKQIHENIGDSPMPKELAAVFRQIADGLRE